MKNNLKLLLLLPLILFLPLGCGEEGTATVDVVKERITKRIQDWVGKGDIVIKKYDNKIETAKNNLIKVKVSRNTFEPKLETQKRKLAAMEMNGASPERIQILRDHIQLMESYLEQVKLAENKLENALKTMIDNRELVKLKVAALEAKRDMLAALQDIQAYTNIEGEVDEMGLKMDSTLSQMQEEIYTIEAEIEVGKLFQEGNMEP